MPYKLRGLNLLVLTNSTTIVKNQFKKLKIKWLFKLIGATKMWQYLICTKTEKKSYIHLQTFASVYASNYIKFKQETSVSTKI